MASGSGYQPPEVAMVRLPLENVLGVDQDQIQGMDEDPLAGLVDRFKSVVGLQVKPKGTVSLEEMQRLLRASQFRNFRFPQTGKRIEPEKLETHENWQEEEKTQTLLCTPIPEDNRKEREEREICVALNRVTRKKMKKKDSKELKVQGGKVTKAKSREMEKEIYAKLFFST